MKLTAQPKKPKNALSKVFKKSKAKRIEHGKFSSADSFLRPRPIGSKLYKIKRSYYNFSLKPRPLNLFHTLQKLDCLVTSLLYLMYFFTRSLPYFLPYSTTEGKQNEYCAWCGVI